MGDSLMPEMTFGALLTTLVSEVLQDMGKDTLTRYEARVLAMPDKIRVLKGDLVDAIRTALNDDADDWNGHYSYGQCAPIEWQIAKISRLFNVSSVEALAFAKNLPKLPEGAEGWFAVLNRDAMEGGWHGSGVRRLLDLVREEYGLGFGRNDLTEKVLGDGKFRLGEVTSSKLHTLYQGQKGPIVILPAQFGRKYARMLALETKDYMVEGEFLLGTFEVLCMTLTHPERITGCFLPATCGGEEFPLPVIQMSDMVSADSLEGDGAIAITRHVPEDEGTCGCVSGFSFSL